MKKQYLKHRLAWMIFIYTILLLNFSLQFNHHMTIKPIVITSFVSFIFMLIPMLFNLKNKLSSHLQNHYYHTHPANTAHYIMLISALLGPITLFSLLEFYSITSIDELILFLNKLMPYLSVLLGTLILYYGIFIVTIIRIEKKYGKAIQFKYDEE